MSAGGSAGLDDRRERESSDTIDSGCKGGRGSGISDTAKSVGT